MDRRRGKERSAIYPSPEGLEEVRTDYNNSVLNGELRLVHLLRADEFTVRYGKHAMRRSSSGMAQWPRAGFHRRLAFGVLRSRRDCGV
jgi:hypothetical protein